MRVIFAKFPLLSKIKTLSHKLLVRQTSNHHHCNWHAQKPPSASDSRTNSTSNSNIDATNNGLNIPEYFRPSPNREADKRASRLKTMMIHSEFSDIFTGISCPQQVLPRRVAYALQEALC